MYNVLSSSACRLHLFEDERSETRCPFANEFMIEHEHPRSSFEPFTTLFNVRLILLDSLMMRKSAMYPKSPLQTKILDVFVGKKQALTQRKEDKIESTVFNGNKQMDKNPSGPNVCRAKMMGTSSWHQFLLVHSRCFRVLTLVGGQIAW